LCCLTVLPYCLFTVIDVAVTYSGQINDDDDDDDDDIAGFLRRVTPPLFHQNFRVVHFGVDCRCCGSDRRSEDRKLINTCN